MTEDTKTLRLPPEEGANQAPIIRRDKVVGAVGIEGSKTGVIVEGCERVIYTSAPVSEIEKALGYGVINLDS